MKLAWQQIPSPVISELLCISGLEGVVLDTEHGCYNNESLAACIQTITLHQKKCFVRLTEIDKTQIRYCLDSGANGIIFSTVETVDQAEKIIKFSCYAPRGERGLGLVRQNLWGQKPLMSEDPILIPQIETAKGVENLESIKNFGFDYYLIGPYDLSLSLGCPGNFEDKKYKVHIDKINDIINKEKLAVHIPNDVQAQLSKYSDYGLMCLGMDTIAVLEYHKEITTNA